MRKLGHWSFLVLAIAVTVIVIAGLVEGTVGPAVGQKIERWLSHPGPGAAAVVFGLLLVDVFLPVPSSLVMISSGALFGVTLGAAIAFAGSLAGNVVGFELSRRYGAPLAQRLLGAADLESLRRTIARHGALAILLSRPLPVVMETLSVVAGLGEMTRPAFLAASLLGTLPLCFVYAYAGSASLEVSSLLPALLVAVGVPALAFVAWKGSIDRGR